MKIGVCLSNYYEDAKIYFAVSLMKTKWPQGSEVNLLLGSGSWWGKAMQMMVKSHLNWGADFIVYIATDIGWEPNDIAKLISHNLPVVCGWGSGRMPPFHCHVTDLYDPKTNRFRTIKNPAERKGVEKVVSVGGELMAFRKDVFEKIPAPWFFAPEMIRGDDFMTEDYFFAVQAQKYGVDLYVDWDVKVQHAVAGLVTYDGKLRARK